MKTLMIATFLFFSAGAQAGIYNCIYQGPDDTYTILTSAQSSPCGNLGYSYSMYSIAEVDSIVRSVRSAIGQEQSVTTNALSKKIADLQARTFVTEEALQREIEIPDSVMKQIRFEIKKELKAELKDELKAEILKELSH